MLVDCNLSVTHVVVVVVVVRVSLYIRRTFLRALKPKRAYPPFPHPVAALFNRFTTLLCLAKGACRLSDMLWPTSWYASARDV